MLSGEEIIKIVNKLAKKISESETAKRKNIGVSTDSKQEAKRIPHIDAVQLKGIRHSQAIRVHTDPDKFPDKLFMEKAPNQTQEEFDYTKRNYRPITLTVMNEFFTALNRIYNRNGWSIDYNTDVNSEDEESFRKYLEDDYPVYDSLFSFFNNIVLKKQNIDPNGVLAIRPKFIPIKETEDGEIVIDQTEIISPVVVYYPIESRFIFKENECLLVLSQERSFIRDGDKNIKEGLVFEYYDTENIWRVFQVGNKSKPHFHIELFWNHGLGVLPVHILGNDPDFIDAQPFYKSPIFPAVAPLDLVATDSSTLQLSVYKNAFPHGWQIEDICDNDQCENGKIKATHMGGESHFTDCPDCKTRASGVMHTYKLRASTDPSGETKIPSEPIGWAAPGTEILTFLQERIQSQILLARQQLKITTSNSAVQGEETALGKQIDREETFTFIKGISDHNFNLLRWAVNTIGRMRDGDDFTKPTIVEPDEFAIKTSSDLSQEYLDGKARGLPGVATNQLLIQYMDKKFNMDDINQQKIELNIRIDRLVSVPPEEIKTLKAQGLATTEELIIHYSFSTLLENAIEKDEEFLSKDFNMQKQAIITEAQLIAASITTSRTPTIDTTTSIS